MPDSIVYRVMFSGDWLPEEREGELGAGGVIWEGSESTNGSVRHRVLVSCSGPRDAIRVVRDAVSGLGDFDRFVAEPVRDAHGNVWRRKFYRRWDEIDWDQPERATFSELQRATMRTLADAAEPTELVVSWVGRPVRIVGKALRELRDKGLVESHTEPYWDGEHGDDHAEWWKLTDEAWDLLGCIKSPRYH